MDLAVPSVEELAMLSPMDLQTRAQEFEVLRRRVEAASALMVQRVDDAKLYVADGHRRVSAWGRATNNWSPPEASTMVKLANAMNVLPKYAAAALAGEIGVGQMHAVAKVAANPRVREHLADADDLFLASARDLPFDDCAIVLRHWEELADADGARGRHDRAMLDRRASVRFVGARSYLDAQGPAHDGVMFETVLEHYVQLEWQTEWDILAAVHGDAMCAGLMERSHAQRTFDALQRIFAAAASAPEAGAVGVTTNIVIDQLSFEHQAEEMFGGDPAPIPPSHAPTRRCEDAKGRVIDPRTRTRTTAPAPSATRRAVGTRTGRTAPRSAGPPSTATSTTSTVSCTRCCPTTDRPAIVGRSSERGCASAPPTSGRCTSMASRPRFSIIVPAHNEEALLPRGLAAVQHAIDRHGAGAEIIVVANRCTDRTESIAEAGGAVVVRDGHRNLSATRNAGVAASSGEILVTVDADTLMHPDALHEVDRLLSTGKFVGGGCRFVLERNSVGLAVTTLAVTSATVLSRTGGVIYWCSREDFDAIGGFDESRRVGEDLDFARRLRLHGRATKRRFRNLREAPATVSVRKFDTFGDWHYLTRLVTALAHPRQLLDLVRGDDPTFADEYFYDFNG